MNTRQPTPDERTGMDWWNSLTDDTRRQKLDYVQSLALEPSPANAWQIEKRDRADAAAINITVQFTAAQAEAFAQFLKRSTLTDYQAKCPPADQEQGYDMQAAGERIRTALAGQGINPR